MNKKTVVIILAAVFTLFGLTGCEKLRERLPEGLGRKGQEAAEPEEVQETVYAVNTIKAVEGQIRDYIELNGDVVTAGTVDVYADTAGKLTVLNIDVGDTVEQGEIIAEVDPSKPGMTFVASPVKSTISGTVVEIPVNLGATIGPSLPVARISKTTERQIRTFVSEKYISKIRRGLYAKLDFAAFPESEFWAVITELSPVVDPQSRTLEIKMKLLSETERIKPGMFAEIKIITESKENAVKLPVDCLINRYGEYFVFIVLEDTSVEKRIVVPGIQIDNKVEIVKGLAPGETVVFQGQTLLSDGSKVKVMEEIPPLDTEDSIE